MLFTSVTVYDPDGEHHGKTVDLLVDGGRVTLNPESRPAGVRTLAFPGLHVSAGWVDVGAAVHEPGHEQRETLNAFLAAASTGGFTRVLAYADTVPTLDTGTAARGVLALADQRFGVSLHLIGALSRGGEGHQLSEIGELVEAGCTFFGDGLRAVQDAKLLQLALAYTQAFDATVVAQPGERRLEGQGQMHEGLVSTMLGVVGLPAMAEVIGLQRDLALLDYRGGRLHVPVLTLAETVRQAAFAKTLHPGLSYGLAVAHLLLDDTALRDYDPDAKLWPPLRSSADRNALRDAVASRSADALVSNHRPQDMESKRVEFPYAAFGAATIEQTFAIARTAMGEAEDVLYYLAVANRRLAGFTPISIRDGANAELTFFLPDQPFTMPKRSLAGMGVNLCAAGVPLVGVPVGTFTGGVWRESRWTQYLGLNVD